MRSSVTLDKAICNGCSQLLHYCKSRIIIYYISITEINFYEFNGGWPCVKVSEDPRIKF